VPAAVKTNTPIVIRIILATFHSDVLLVGEIVISCHDAPNLEFRIPILDVFFSPAVIVACIDIYEVEALIFDLYKYKYI